VFLHSHAGKKSDLVERGAFTLVAPSLRTVGSRHRPAVRFVLSIASWCVVERSLFTYRLRSFACVSRSLASEILRAHRTKSGAIG